MKYHTRRKNLSFLREDNKSEELNVICAKIKYLSNHLDIINLNNDKSFDLINLITKYGFNIRGVYAFTTFNDFIELEIENANNYDDASKLVNYIYNSIKYGDCAPGDPCYITPKHNYALNATDKSGEDIFKCQSIDLSDLEIEVIARKLEGSWQYIHSLVDDDEI